MKIQSNAEEVIITISRKEMDVESVEKLVKTLRYRELLSKSKASAKQIKQITGDIKKGIGKKLRQPVKKWI